MPTATVLCGSNEGRFYLYEYYLFSRTEIILEGKVIAAGGTSARDLVVRKFTEEQYDLYDKDEYSLSIREI